MKILFISSSPINKSISGGNTFLNIFEGIKEVELFSLYARNGLPDAKIKKAFLITEKMILKGGRVGEEVTERYNGEEFLDGNAVRFAKKKRWTLLFWIQNLIWKIPNWKSKRLKAFLDLCNPDIIFTVLSDSAPLNNMIQHVCRQTKKPLVLYAWDDNYSMRSAEKTPLKKLMRWCNRFKMRKIARQAKEFYVISQIQKRDYEKWFARSCKILTKSADFSLPPSLKERYSSPMQLIFTGNIGMNRWKSLALLAKVVKEINGNGIKLQLRIYTATPVTNEMRECLQIEGSSYLMGSVAASEVERLQKESDVLVHVESLDRKNEAALKHSLSTKLVDYFKAARPILAVGPRGVASIEHLRENNCALLAETEEELFEKLKPLIDDYERLHILAKNAYECGRKNHDETTMKQMLERDMRQLCEANK